MKRIAIVLMIVLAYVFGVANMASAEPWVPVAGERWQWQLSSVPTVSQRNAMQAAGVKAYDIDGFETPASVVTDIHNRGMGAVCYLSVGSAEVYRPDYNQFPSFVKGRKVQGWNGEYWLDIRRLDILGPIMTARFQMCKDKGFNAVEPDLMDGAFNRTGFPLTAADQLNYNLWVADTVHSLGLTVVHKAVPELVPQMVDHFDWALNEECAEYDECDAYQPYRDQGKAVWHVEYTLSKTQFCPYDIAHGWSGMKKTYDLTGSYDPC